MNSFETPETSPGWGSEGEGDLLAPRRTPRLIVMLECNRPLAPARRLALDGLDHVIIARGASGAIERSGQAAMIAVTDAAVSREHLAFRRCESGWQVEDLGSRNGTAVNGETVRVAMLNHGDLVEAGGAMLVFLDDDPEFCEVRDRELVEPSAWGSDPGRSSGAMLETLFRTVNVELERRLSQIRKIAPSVVPVLVRGETGTGKELAARAIHEVSGRSGPFVAVNCGALPRDLVESELFGHRRGAFSGATEDREGLVRHAHKGTLFLDEIAELPPDSQVALLRVLQEGEVRPVGAGEATRVDLRVVAATHQDLHQRIADGLFRQDLYSRIAGFVVTMPPLRDRREDLGLLIAAILPRVCPEPERVVLHKQAARALFAYPWPFNIRELEQALRAALSLCDGGRVRLEHLPAAIRDYEPPGMPAMNGPDAVLRERLTALLRDSRGNIAAVSRAMDRAPNQIRRWCYRLNIDLAAFRT